MTIYGTCVAKLCLEVCALCPKESNELYDCMCVSFDCDLVRINEIRTKGLELANKKFKKIMQCPYRFSVHQ